VIAGFSVGLVIETRSLPNLLSIRSQLYLDHSHCPCPRFDSCAPAHIDLSVCPSMSLAPRGSILAPTLVTLPSMPTAP